MFPDDEGEICNITNRSIENVFCHTIPQDTLLKIGESLGLKAISKGYIPARFKNQKVDTIAWVEFEKPSDASSLVTEEIEQDLMGLAKESVVLTQEFIQTRKAKIIPKSPYLMINL